jgi:hypothetical protein
MSKRQTNHIRAQSLCKATKIIAVKEVLSNNFVSSIGIKSNRTKVNSETTDHDSSAIKSMPDIVSPRPSTSTNNKRMHLIKN